MAGGKFFQERQFLRADVLPLPAAGMEGALRRGMDGARHITGEDAAPIAVCYTLGSLLAREVPPSIFSFLDSRISTRWPLMNGRRHAGKTLYPFL